MSSGKFRIIDAKIGSIDCSTAEGKGELRE
jgi:hypothetical protein